MNNTETQQSEMGGDNSELSPRGTIYSVTTNQFANSSPDPNQRIQRQSIEGMVTLQSKSHWVVRYAQIKECIFSYKKTKSDTTPRYFVDLRTCELNRGQRTSGDYFLQIKDPTNKIVKVSFENKSDFKRWGSCFVQSMKSDAELYRL